MSRYQKTPELDMPKKPPRLAVALLRCVLPPKDRDYLLGDYEESFQKKHEEKNALSASIWYWGQLIRTAPAYFIESFYWRIVMLRNYLIVAYRNSRKHTLFTLVNILGLAIGMTGCFFAFSIILQEFSYDKFFNNHEQIFRITRYQKHHSDQSEVNFDFATTPAPMAKAISEEYAEVRAVTNINRPLRRTVSYKNNHINIERVSYANDNFFQVFSFRFIEGDPKTALQDLWSVVISKETAKRLFGNEPALGKLVYIQKRWAPIKGVIQDLPENIHFHFDMLISMSDITELDWDKNTHYTYILLNNHADNEALGNKLTSLVQKYVPEHLWKASDSDLSSPGLRTRYNLQPLTKIHLDSHLQQEIEPGGNLQKIVLISIISLFVLLLACMNFINLKTAQMTQRSKEVGIRYVLGSNQKQLIFQFLVESISISYLSMILAICFTTLLKTQTLLLYGTQIDQVTFGHKGYLGFIIIFPLFIGFLSGSLPAIYLSSLKTIRILKNQIKLGHSFISLRKILISFQFTISIGLMICTFIILKQNRFLTQTTPGLTKENILVIDNVRHPLPEQHVQSFKTSLLNYPSISNVAISQIYLTQEICKGTFLPENNNQSFDIQYDRIDNDFIDAYGIYLLEGRNFDQSHSDDIHKVLINKAAAEKFNWQYPLNKIVYFQNKPYQVIGIMENFMLNSLHNEIEPFVFFYLDKKIPKWCYITIKIDDKNIRAALDIIEGEWQIRTEEPIKYNFMDDTIQSLYSNERQLSKIFLFLTILGIVIANLGLLGLVHFVSAQRTKEIGIRKVLGASITGIIALLTKDFAKLILLANCISWPIAWLVMSQWLQNYAYRTDLNWWIFALAGLSTLIITILTVSWQSIRAATMNPVESLRYE